MSPYNHISKHFSPPTIWTYSTQKKIHNISKYALQKKNYNYCIPYIVNQLQIDFNWTSTIHISIFIITGRSKIYKIYNSPSKIRNNAKMYENLWTNCIPYMIDELKNNYNKTFQFGEILETNYMHFLQFYIIESNNYSHNVFPPTVELQ